MENKESFDGMEAVWERVRRAGETSATGGCGPIHEDGEKARLERFMDRTAGTESAYGRLYRCRRQSRHAPLFRGLATEEARHMTELQTAYYLLEGDSYVPKAPEPFEVSLPGALRILYGMERSAAAEFRSAADTAEDPSAAALYRRLEDGAKKHAAQLFGLIKTFMV